MLAAVCVAMLALVEIVVHIKVAKKGARDEGVSFSYKVGADFQSLRLLTGWLVHWAH